VSIPKTMDEAAQHYGRSPVRPVGPRLARKRTKAKRDRAKAKRRRLMAKTSRRRNRK
jgi:hypothetical protein